MLKKIKDLTYDERKKICDDHINKICEECPLFNLTKCATNGWEKYVNDILRSAKTLETEVEVEE